MRRTLLAVGFAVLLSMMFMPCTEWGFWGWNGPQPFWIAADRMTAYEWRFMWPKLIVQTVFLAVLFTVIVNLRKPREKKTQ
jgi:hypothetical protein